MKLVIKHGAASRKDIKSPTFVFDLQNGFGYGRRILQDERVYSELVDCLQTRRLAVRDDPKSE